jgi:general secretion pathway protein G
MEVTASIWTGLPPRGRTVPFAGGSGFTLIEVMIAVAIAGVLASIATPIYIGYRERARDAVAIIDLRNIEQAVIVYAAENSGTFPDSLADINMDDMRDPWGNPYQYLRIEGSDIKGKGKLRRDQFYNPVNTDFDLYSMGPDGRSQTQFNAKFSRDDVVRAYNGGYYGKVSDI